MAKKIKKQKPPKAIILFAFFTALAGPLYVISTLDRQSSLSVTSATYSPVKNEKGWTICPHTQNKWGRTKKGGTWDDLSSYPEAGGLSGGCYVDSSFSKAEVSVTQGSLKPTKDQGGSDTTLTTPTPNSTLTSTIQTFIWTNDGNPQRQFDLHVGSTVGGEEYLDTEGLGTGTSVEVTNLPTDGSPVYIRIHHTDDGWVTKTFTDYVVTAVTVKQSKTVPILIEPKEPTDSTHRINWLDANPVDGRRYDLLVDGVDQGSSVVAPTTSWTINGLTPGSHTVELVWWDGDDFSTAQRLTMNITTKDLTPPQINLYLENNFSNESLGIYTDSEFKADSDWKNIKFSGYGNRISIINDSGDKKMRVTYPAGAYGHSRGGGTALVRLGSHNELYFRQTFKFESGFDFVKGGKIPGLSGDEETWTGGATPSKGQGFSARYMWRENGRAVLYLYHPDQKSIWGTDVSLGFSFRTNVDYTLTQRIKRNTGTSKNGIIQTWVSENGGKPRLVLNLNNVRTGFNGGGAIDSILVTTFHGGGDSSWAPSRTSYMQYDDFQVSETKFTDLP